MEGQNDLTFRYFPSFLFNLYLVPVMIGFFSVYVLFSHCQCYVTQGDCFLQMSTILVHIHEKLTKSQTVTSLENITWSDLVK